MPCAGWANGVQRHRLQCAFQPLPDSRTNPENKHVQETDRPNDPLRLRCRRCFHAQVCCSAQGWTIADDQEKSAKGVRPHSGRDHKGRWRDSEILLPISRFKFRHPSTRLTHRRIEMIVDCSTMLAERIMRMQVLLQLSSWQFPAWEMFQSVLEKPFDRFQFRSFVSCRMRVSPVWVEIQ